MTARQTDIAVAWVLNLDLLTERHGSLLESLSTCYTDVSTGIPTTLIMRRTGPTYRVHRTDPIAIPRDDFHPDIYQRYEGIASSTSESLHCSTSQ